ncbi:cbf nf-y family transcription factor [Phlyctema vagabunda]|uniref:Cbf nf-y family transcription factor n=1 Tax=Phlyctema vagabunda TaxID=108571 RepID=A0ABR4P6F7_9HELO
MATGSSNDESRNPHPFVLKDYKDNCDERPPFAECALCTPGAHGPGLTGCNCTTMQEQRLQSQSHQSTSSLYPDVPAFQPFKRRNESKQASSSRNIAYGDDDERGTNRHPHENRTAGAGYHRGVRSPFRGPRCRANTSPHARQLSSGSPHGQRGRPWRISSLGSPRRASGSVQVNFLGPASPRSFRGGHSRDLGPPPFHLPTIKSSNPATTQGFFKLEYPTVQKIVTEILPTSSGLAFGKDARDLLIECCVEFITLISSEANEISEKESKKTIACEHITKALEQLDFSEYVQYINEVANEHKEQLKGREKKANKLEQSGLSTEQLLAMQEEAFRDAAQRHG